MIRARKFQAGTAYEVGNHARDQRLVRSGLCHNACGSMHRDTTGIASPNFDLAAVQARA
jgi:hypothetical protein